jgi:hypothetical protein
MLYWLSSFSLLYIIIIFLFAPLTLIANLENAYRNPPQNSLLCDWSTPTIRTGTLAFGLCGIHRPLHSRIGIMRYEWLPHILLISKYYGASHLS